MKNSFFYLYNDIIFVGFLYTRSLSLQMRDCEQSDYTPMILQESLDDDSLKIPLDKSFPVSSATFHDPEAPSKDHEDEHNIIPATLPDCDINKPVSVSTEVDDPTAKLDNLPQI